MVIVVEKLIRKKDTNIKGRTKIRLQALGLTRMIKDVGLYDVVFIFWKLTNLNFETPQMCYAWPHLYHFFFGSWQHGIFFIIKDFVSKIQKGKRLFGQECLIVLDKSKKVPRTAANFWEIGGFWKFPLRAKWTIKMWRTIDVTTV